MMKTTFKNLIFVFIISLFFHSNIYAGNCIGDSRIHFIHLRANELLQATKKQINQKVPTPAVVEGLRQFFKVELDNPDHQKYIKKIFKKINRMASKVHKTKYYCDEKNETLVCTKNNKSGSKIFGKKVYLCPGFFNPQEEIHKVGIMLHQWVHVWGKNIILPIFEKSCRDAANLQPKKLIRVPDQYMQFIYWIGTKGKFIGCF
jgi:hypothetical protein